MTVDYVDIEFNDNLYYNLYLIYNILTLYYILKKRLPTQEMPSLKENNNTYVICIYVIVMTKGFKSTIDIFLLNYNIKYQTKQFQ